MLDFYGGYPKDSGIVRPRPIQLSERCGVDTHTDISMRPFIDDSPIEPGDL